MARYFCLFRKPNALFKKKPVDLQSGWQDNSQIIILPFYFFCSKFVSGSGFAFSERPAFEHTDKKWNQLGRYRNQVKHMWLFLFYETLWESEDKPQIGGRVLKECKSQLFCCVKMCSKKGAVILSLMISKYSRGKQWFLCRTFGHKIEI